MKFRALFVGSCVALVACQLFVSVQDEEGVPAPAPKDPCVHVVPVSAPDGSFDSNDIGPQFFAVRVFGSTNDAGVLGYDLDNHCTGDDASTTNAPSCTSSTPLEQADGDGGIDDAFQKSLQTNPNGSFVDDVLSANARTGRYTLLVQLTQWNGQDDDNSVNVALIASSGLQCVQQSDCVDAGDDAGPTFLPQWNGLDVWTYTDETRQNELIPSSTVGVPVVSNRAHHGYITRGHLVVRDGVDLEMGFNATSITLTSPIITADVVHADGGVVLQNGIVTGASRIENTIKFLKRSLVPQLGIPSCKLGSVFSTFKTQLCQFSDIRVDGDAGACDAFSVAFGFEAEPALISGTAGGASSDDPCIGVDSGPDDCSP